MYMYMYIYTRSIIYSIWWKDIETLPLQIDSSIVWQPQS